jgi:hypothetical protein
VKSTVSVEINSPTAAQYPAQTGKRIANQEMRYFRRLQANLTQNQWGSHCLAWQLGEINTPRSMDVAGECSM